MVTESQPSPQPQAPRKSENRRSNKPIMEKRRRARINNCLNELKSLILDAMKKDPARHSKLEKADILEMTVKHLENMQRQQVALAAATDPKVLNKFRAGFTECAGEVGRFPGLEPPVKRRLLQHLANCLNSNIQQEEAVAKVAPAPAPNQQQVQVTILPEQNIVFSTANLQLVPTRLPNGDIALVLPSSQVRTSAVSPVGSHTTTSSSTPSPPPVVSSPPPLTMRPSPNPSPLTLDRLKLHSPPAPASSPGYRTPSPTSSLPDQAPLSLVMRKPRQELIQEKACWRPW